MTTPPTPPDPTQDPSSDLASRTLVTTLTLTVFLAWMGATALVPLLPLFIRHIGGSDAMAGVVMGSFFAAGVLCQYPLGHLADRRGRKPILIGGLVCYAIASALFIAHINVGQAIALRSIQGVGAGAVEVASLALVSALVPTARRGVAFAKIYAGQIAGMAVGPFVGTLLGLHHMNILFLASAAVTLLACIPASRIIDRPHTRGHTHTDLPPLVPNRAMLGVLVTGTALGLAGGVYDICWTLLLVSRGATSIEIGISWTLFAIPFVLTARLAGRLADRLDRRVLVIGGIATTALFCATYPFITAIPVLIILGALEATAFAMVLPASQSLLTQRTAPEAQGRLQGLLATCSTAATALAATAAGAAFAISRQLPFLATSASIVVLLVVAALLWRTVPGHVDHTDETPPA